LSPRPRTSSTPNRTKIHSMQRSLKYSHLYLGADDSRQSTGNPNGDISPPLEHSREPVPRPAFPDLSPFWSHAALIPRREMGLKATAVALLVGNFTLFCPRPLLALEGGRVRVRRRKCIHRQKSLASVKPRSRKPCRRTKHL
jgi:hypothetical protein